MTHIEWVQSLFTKNKKKKDIPFYKRMEIWKSPFIIFLIPGCVIYGIVYGLWWLIKFLLFSCVRPFSNSEWICNQGFHKYRYQCNMNEGQNNLYECVVCKKTKMI